MATRYLILLGILNIIYSSGIKEEKITEGHFYPNWLNIPLPSGLKTTKTLSSRIKLGLGCNNYEILSGDVNRCEGSWNKLYGSSRCFLSLHHRDSDRFVWRRSRECYHIEEGKVVEVPNCPDINNIEIAAYAYDDHNKPFQHYGTLLKIFNTKVQIYIWYTYTIRFYEDRTQYVLADAHGKQLEIQEIIHRKCWKYNWGYMLGFYFGGACPAPHLVKAFYQDLQ